MSIVRAPEVRLRFKLPNNKKRSIWALELSPTLYRVIKRDGELTYEFVVVTANDIISKKKAVMNNKYAEFEVVEDK